MFFSKTKSNESKAYTFQGELKGHNGPILCITASVNGLVAGGGADGVKIWDIGEEKDGQVPIKVPVGAGIRGATTAMTWVIRDDEPDDGLVFGTQCGYLVCWKEGDGAFIETQCHKVANPGEITGIAFEASSNRVCSSNRNGVIQLYAVSPGMTLQVVWSISIDAYVPKSVAFRTDGENRQLMVSGLYDGIIHTLRESDGKIEHTRDVGGMIGSVAINPQKGVFCIDDPTEGVGLFRLDSGSRHRTFPVPVKRSWRPRQVCFAAEDCSVIVSGSDHGIIYVFNRRTGDTMHKLEIANGNWVQTVAATNLNGTLTVFGARSQDIGGPNSILYWTLTLPKNSTRKSGRNLGWYATVVLLVVLCLFFYVKAQLVATMKFVHPEVVELSDRIAQLRAREQFLFQMEQEEEQRWAERLIEMEQEEQRWAELRVLENTRRPEGQDDKRMQHRQDTGRTRDETVTTSTPIVESINAEGGHSKDIAPPDTATATVTAGVAETMNNGSWRRLTMY
ncbi:hypothetical protein H0H93_007561 [Arthromyces matolae]|nr:hypothetical protein H0H93_007561 [Arthromyces matolae]